MSESGILQQALTCTRCAAGEATHFALCNGGQVRFYISLNGGAARLARNVAAYGGKLQWLMRLLPVLPWRLLQAAHLGYFVRAELHPAVQELVPQGAAWNMLVGTYDERQKLVLQCFRPADALCTFIKIGNTASAPQMEAETDYLRGATAPQSFRLPELLGCRLMREGAPFNLQVTREFTGGKVAPELTEDIYRIYKEISSSRPAENGNTFSHGDFAPWNLRREGNDYTVFDWEHCAMRPAGYDLVYYTVITEIALNGQKFTPAFETALAAARRFEPQLHMDKDAFYACFSAVIKQLEY